MASGFARKGAYLASVAELLNRRFLTETHTSALDIDPAALRTLHADVKEKANESAR
jgi:hypothetical protein